MNCLQGTLMGTRADERGREAWAKIFGCVALPLLA